jgi:hypothetical protein
MKSTSPKQSLYWYKLFIVRRNCAMFAIMSQDLQGAKLQYDLATFQRISPKLDSILAVESLSRRLDCPAAKTDAVIEPRKIHDQEYQAECGG